MCSSVSLLALRNYRNYRGKNVCALEMSWRMLQSCWASRSTLIFTLGIRDSQAATSLSLHGSSLSLLLLLLEMWAFLPVFLGNIGNPPSSSLPTLGNFLTGDTQHNLEVSKHGANARTPHNWLLQQNSKRPVSSKPQKYPQGVQLVRTIYHIPWLLIKIPWELE